MPREKNSWRYVSISLGVLLAISAIVNLSGIFQIPQQITLFMVGALIAMGVGYSILNPSASLSRLNPAEEKRFRSRQYAVGLFLSLLLGLTMIDQEIRDSPLVWLFLPIIALPGVLLLNEHNRQKRPRSARMESKRRK